MYSEPIKFQTAFLLINYENSTLQIKATSKNCGLTVYIYQKVFQVGHFIMFGFYEFHYCFKY